MGSVIVIIVYSAAFCGLLWLTDKTFAEENQRRKGEEREIQREEQRFENTVWEITTRVQDSRADLFRTWAELEVQNERA